MIRKDGRKSDKGQSAKRISSRGGGRHIRIQEDRMKIAVRYYTKTGNTKKLAEAVANAIGEKALPISSPITEPV